MLSCIWPHWINLTAKRKKSGRNHPTVFLDIWTINVQVHSKAYTRKLVHTMRQRCDHQSWSNMYDNLHVGWFAFSHASAKRQFCVEWLNIRPTGSSICLLWWHDVIKWKHFPRYWPFVRGIHRSPLNSTHKGQWRGAVMFSLICASINNGVKNREAGTSFEYIPWIMHRVYSWLCLLLLGIDRFYPYTAGSIGFGDFTDLLWRK